MNPKSQYVEDQSKQCREHWFKDHRAHLNIQSSEAEDTQVIKWQNPASWNYGCRFIIHRRWLCVVGDIGEAVFEWSQDLTLEFLAGMDFGYFHSKCRSSETGRHFNGWNGDFAIQKLKEFLDDRRSELVEILEEAEGFAANEHEWTEWLYHGGNKIGDDDYSLADAGSIPHPRAIGMFVGLQMAIKQLKAQT